MPFGLVVLAGAQWAPAAHMGIFMAGCMPLFVNLGGRLVHGERLGGARALGLLLMGLGVAALGLGVWRGGLAAWSGDVLVRAGGLAVGHVHAGVPGLRAVGLAGGGAGAGGARHRAGQRRRYRAGVQGAAACVPTTTDCARSSATAGVIRSSMMKVR